MGTYSTAGGRMGVSTWESQCLTCMHGVKEGIDWHNCPGCRWIAEAMDLTWIDHKQTYIYLSLPKELKTNPEFSRSFGE